MIFVQEGCRLTAKGKSGDAGGKGGSGGGGGERWFDASGAGD